MKLFLPVWSLPILFIVAIGIAACTATQAEKAQATLGKAETDTTQASAVTGAVNTAVPTPLGDSISQILLAVLAGEKLLGTYVIPALVKAAKAGNGGMGDTSQSNSNTTNNTTKPPSVT